MTFAKAGAVQMVPLQNCRSTLQRAPADRSLLTANCLVQQILQLKPDVVLVIQDPDP